MILNLITNAFYACTERSRSIVNEKSNDERKNLSDLEDLKGLAHYKPTVSLSTKMKNKIIEIKVRDNGNGIPENVLDKIFQHFFTTKPTGQGTGLGLSLSYDILKAHGGRFEVQSQPN